MVTEIANKYRALLGMLPELIEISGYRNDYLSKKMGITPATFSAKKQRGNWSADDVVNLMTIIENEDVDDYCMLHLMRESKKNEDTLTTNDFRKAIGKLK